MKAQDRNLIAGVIALAIIVAGFVLAPEERVDKLGHALAALSATTGGQMIYAALVALAVAVLRWALAKVPATALDLRGEPTDRSTEGMPPPPSSDADDTAPVGRPRRVTRQGFAGLGPLLAILVGAAIAVLLHGCGAALSADQRSAYAAEVALCEQNEAAIINSAPTTWEHDQAALADERRRCDAARAAIEGGR